MFNEILECLGFITSLLSSGCAEEDGEYGNWEGFVVIEHTPVQLAENHKRASLTSPLCPSPVGLSFTHLAGIVP